METLRALAILDVFLLSADCFQIILFKKSECQTVWIQNRPEVLSGTLCLQSLLLSIDDTSRWEVLSGWLFRFHNDFCE